MNSFMKEIDLKHIWKNANKKENQKKGYSIEEIHAYRIKKSLNTYRSGRRIILFDIGYKGISVIALNYLMLFLNYPNQLILGLVLTVTLVLMIIELTFIKQLKLIKETDSVIENLKNKLNFLKTTYKKFIFIGALSNPLFVLSGFLLYDYFKYNGISINSPFKDPVMYLFLFAAYIFSFFAQIPTYRNQLNELKECIDDMDDTKIATIKIEKAKKNIIEKT